MFMNRKSISCNDDINLTLKTITFLKSYIFAGLATKLPLAVFEIEYSFPQSDDTNRGSFVFDEKRMKEGPPVVSRSYIHWLFGIRKTAFVLQFSCDSTARWFSQPLNWKKKSEMENK